MAALFGAVPLVVCAYAVAADAILTRLPPFDSASESAAQFRPLRSGAPDRVLVKKAERTLYLLRDDVPIRRYAISLGFAPHGHKHRQGDGRTPEGRYRLDWRNPRSRYHRSLHLSYPNQADRLRARLAGHDPGGMIMLHGQPDGASSNQNISGDWTNGCIAVDTPQIDEIWALVEDGTPIEILP